ncbi:MAG: hypothetical protein N2111_08665 [Candidatus Sumerlaeaceae bacterium]|nr:hypothetical protein [Candidatus Sumerlaeaceae bacterium]
MKLKKRDQIVAISIGALLFIGLVHMVIFKPRAELYEQVSKEYSEGITLLQSVPQPSSPQEIPKFREQTTVLDNRVTSVIEELRLNIPPYYGSRRPEAVERRLNDCVALLKELMELKATLKNTRLSFLDDRRQNPNNPFEMQMGWNLPLKIDEGRPGVLWDNVTKLQDRWVLLNGITNPLERLQERIAYNDLLNQIGIRPAEVSDWVAPIQIRGISAYVFFNDIKRAEEVLNARLLQNVQALEGLRNPLSTNRFGVLVPSLKKLWMSELIYEKRDPKSPIDKARLRDILEVNMPTDHALLATNKQLESLIDIIKKADKNGVTEISQVNLMKPVALMKFEGRKQEESTAPAATPAVPTPMAGPANFGAMMDPAMMGGPYAGFGMMTPTPVPEGEKVGGGAGIEMWFTANNANMIQFLFDITHAPRSYTLDDLDIQAMPDRTLRTSATIELVTNIEGK